MNDFFVSVSEQLPRLDRNNEALDVEGQLPDECMYGVSRRYDGSRPQSVFVLACVRLWLCRPIRDAQSRPQT